MVRRWMTIGRNLAVLHKIYCLFLFYGKAMLLFIFQNSFLIFDPMMCVNWISCKLKEWLFVSIWMTLFFN